MLSLAHREKHALRNTWRCSPKFYYIQLNMFFFIMAFILYIFNGYLFATKFRTLRISIFIVFFQLVLPMCNNIIFSRIACKIADRSTSCSFDIAPSSTMLLSPSVTASSSCTMTTACVFLGHWQLHASLTSGTKAPLKYFLTW